MAGTHRCLRRESGIARAARDFTKRLVTSRRTWRAFENTITGRKYADGDNCWQYVVNPTGTAFSFQDVSEAVAFLGGYKIADDWHEDMNEKMEAAQQQSDEAAAKRLTQPE